jgi:ketosteroid isomerase-like protein
MSSSDTLGLDWRTPLRALLTFLFLLPILSTNVHAQTGPGDAVEQFHLAIARADRATAAAILAPNVQIFESGFVERSRDEYLAHHFDADAKFAKSVARKVVRQTEQVAGDMALVMAETEAGGSYEGKPVKLIGTETAVLRLEGGKWRIVHIHWSSRKPKA